MAETYVLDYARKEGLKIFNPQGTVIHKISPVKVGNMFCPSPDEMGDFIQGLEVEDTLVSPSGPNQSYLAGAFQKGVQVFWINPARLTDEGGKGASGQELVRIWREKPGIFYPYMESDLQIAQLDIYFASFLRVEDGLVALQNSLSQALRKMMEEFRFLTPFLTPSKSEWVGKKVKAAIDDLRAVARTGKVKLPPEVVETFRENKQKEMETIYDFCFAGRIGDKDKKELERAKEAWMFSETRQLRARLKGEEKEYIKYLESLPHMEFFEDLMGVGPRSAAGVLVSIANPLLYPSFLHLNAYIGLRVMEGAAIRRIDPPTREALRYDHEAKTVYCFDFGDKAHYHQGFFQDLYHVYKLHQYLIYWPLIVLSNEVYPLGENKEPEDNLLKQWIKTLGEMAPSLPVISRSVKKTAWVKRLQTNPNWESLKKLFSPAKDGGNILMTPKRIELEAKRMNGRTLAAITYYRWLSYLGQPLPIERDHIYQKQYRGLYGKEPENYDHYVTLAHYQAEVKRLQKFGKTIPEEIWEKFPPELRLK